MKRLLSSLALSTTLVLPTVHADDCFYTIKEIQPQLDNVLFWAHEGGWHNIGLIHTESTDLFVKQLNIAQLTGQKLMVRYPGVYACTDTDYSTTPIAVRLMNN